MTNQRYAELMNSQTKPLSPEERAEGWHFCWEWDGLLVGPEMHVEWGDNEAACQCGYKKPC